MFLFRLALALGFPHPDFLLQILTPSQLDEWAEYYRHEPWGSTAQDLRDARRDFQFARAHGSKARFDDFLHKPPKIIADTGSQFESFMAQFPDIKVSRG